MTDAEKLEKVKGIYNHEEQIARGHFSSDHVRHNLLGAFIDMKRTGKMDKTCEETIERVMGQLAEIEKVLGI